jgi:hypothetical protein
MLLIHLSDIHFRRGEVGTAMDPNASLRNELVRDAEAKCKEIGKKPSAVLISGDIAFGGDRAEYLFALTWIEEFCCRCGADPDSVFVIPGNHDVDRKRAGSLIVQSIHNDIKVTEKKYLDRKLANLLADKETGALLYQSIEAYNDFALQFYCDLKTPDRTTAKRTLLLNDGSILKITGFNSAFTSSECDKIPDLFVDPACFQLKREAGVEHLVLCHHPYNWLRNGYQLEQHLNSVSRIQLFGHEHTSRITNARDYLKIAASAAHPDRTEDGWEPGYNLIELEVLGKGDERKLKTRVHVRVWQQNPDEFRAKTDHRSDTFDNLIGLEPWQPSEPLLDANKAKPHDAVPSEIGAARASATVKVDPMDPLRDVGVRFFKLTLSQKMAVTGQLDLIEEEDAHEPDYERFRRAFLRARDRGLIGQLDEAIKAASK